MGYDFYLNRDSSKNVFGERFGLNDFICVCNFVGLYVWLYSTIRHRKLWSIEKMFYWVTCHKCDWRKQHHGNIIYIIWFCLNNTWCPLPSQCHIHKGIDAWHCRVINLLYKYECCHGQYIKFHCLLATFSNLWRSEDVRLPPLQNFRGGRFG